MESSGEKQHPGSFNSLKQFNNRLTTNLYYHSTRTTGMILDPGSREDISVTFEPNGTCTEEQSHANGDMYWDNFLYGTYVINSDEIVIKYTEAASSDGWMVMIGNRSKIDPPSIKTVPIVIEGNNVVKIGSREIKK